MTTPVPEWLTADLFVSVLEKNVENFKKIQHFSAKTAFAAGENYLSVLWSIEIEVVLKDGSSKVVKYMLKVPPTSPMAVAIINMMNSFQREETCYYELLPAFAEMYRKAGKVIQFAPKAFKFDKDLGFEVILMEDVRTEGYKNMNRLEGLDMEHTECALRKLAAFHAASATYITDRESLPEPMMKPVLTDDMLSMLAKSQKPQEQKLMANLALYNAEDMRDKILNYQPIYLRQLLASQERSPQAFNVLSHGDCWSNNIMYQHDSEGRIINTLFVDFQTGKLTSPALDLTYFLLSSTCLENKVNKFDNFIKYYHDHLVENLKILNYPRALPTLREVHKWLYDFSFMAYTVVLKSLPVTLLDPASVNDITMDNMMGDKSDGGAMEHVMYTSERYCKHLQQILPWMENRGYFE